MLDAQLGTGRYRRFEAEVQTARQIGTVRDLVEGRCFHAATQRGIDIDVLIELVLERNNRQQLMESGIAAVVLVGQEMVARLELHIAPAQAGIELPARCKGPGGLQIGVYAGEGIALVTHQLADHAQLVAHKVLVALAVFPDSVGGQARNQAQAAAAQLVFAAPARIDAAIVALETDHPTPVAGLRCLGRGLKLHHFALTGIGHEAQRLAAVQLALIGQAGLGLLHAFARIVEQGVGRHSLRICRPVLGRDAAGVLGIDVHMVGDQG